MISVDDRIGSVELIPILQAIAPSICSAKTATVPKISSARLLCGDVCFDGLGQHKTVAIGVERKRLRDMLSSIRSGRYSGHQLPEMLEYYDESYLIIEGYARCGGDGTLETLITHAHPLGDTLGGKWFPLQIGSQTFRYTELDHFCCTMERYTGVHLRRTNTDYETCSQIISLYTHYQQPSDSHHAHQSLHRPQTLVTIGKAGLVRKVAACLTGVGWDRSGSVAIRFKTVKEMVEASPAEWESIKPGFGKVLSKRAYDQLRGDYKDKGEL